MQLKIPKIYIFLNFIIFLPGFIFGVIDPIISIFLYEKLISLNKFIFWIAYLLEVYMLFKTANIFMKTTSYFVIKPKNTIKENIGNFFKIFFISIYVGYFINISNTFLMASLSFFN